MRSRSRLAAELMPVLLALVITACGGSDSGATTTTQADPAGTTSTAADTTTTTDGATTTAAPATTAAPPTGELATVLEGGTYLVGAEIMPGFWVADECGCMWWWVAEDGTRAARTGEDAEVRDTDYAIELAGCTWTYEG